jgi:aminopeptidase N
VHEISHEWFGNAVTPARWKDIWLNEGFARFSEWLFTEKTAGQSAQASFQAAYDARPATSSFWNLRIGSPTAETMFASSIYTRGGMTLQALRQKIGNDAFSTLLKRWYAENKYANVTTADFVALAEDVSGQQLDAFFQTWLYTSGKPTTW